MDTNFVVYEHYTPDTNEIFYVGEGRPDRPYSTRNRNRFWKFKVKKHNGFVVKIIHTNIEKTKAEELEKELILYYKKNGITLTNLCDGTMFDSHWLIGKPKEIHPMFGSSRTNPKLAEWNKIHCGDKSPVYGLKRPDLSERNKNGNFKRFTRKIKCVELDIDFNSIKEAKTFFNGNSNINRALSENKTAFGYHWVYIN